MNIEQIDKKIEELNKKRAEILAKPKTNKLFKFKDLEITQIQDWSKPYNKIVIPSGFRLIKVWELWELLESPQRDEFLGSYKGKWNYFWCEQTNYAKENNYSSRLYLYWDLDVSSRSDDLAYSSGGGRVCMVRVAKNSKHKKANFKGAKK